MDVPVSDGELAQIISNHLSLYVDYVEYFSIVHGNGRTNHLRYNDHISEVSFYSGRSVKRTGGCICDDVKWWNKNI